MSAYAAPARPDVRKGVTPYSAQMPLALAGAGYAGLHSMAYRGGGLGMAADAAFNSPAMMFGLVANPKGRMAQMRADQSYLGVNKKDPMHTARTADFSVGGLESVRKTSARLGLTKAAAGRFGNIAGALLAAPVAVGGVFAMDRAYRGAARMWDAAATRGRFNAAMAGMDPADFGDPSFEQRYAEDPEAMTAALRDAFTVLNRNAPSVAKDPILAREYMRRMVLDPTYRQPPEEYLRQVTQAVQLENAMQSARPSLFEGIGGMAATVAKG